MNMSNITFHVPRLRTFVFKKSSAKKIFTIIFLVKSLKCFSWNNVCPASQTLPNIISQLGDKVSPVWQSEKTQDNHPILFQCWASVEYD